MSSPSDCLQSIREPTYDLGDTSTPEAAALAEARWEMEGVRRAARRYKEAAAAKDASTLPSGQKLLRAVVPPMIGRVAHYQAIAQTGLRSRWAMPIQMLDAKTLALITVIRAMNAAREPSGLASTIAGAAGGIGFAVQDEVNYRAWVEDQAKRNAAAKAAQDWEHVDLLKAFKRTYPDANRSTWSRWAKRVKAARLEPWDTATRVQLGSALLKALVEAAPAWFSISLVRAAEGKTVNRLLLSGEAMAVMQSVEERATIARPMLMPMLTPPVPWHYA